MSKIDATSQIQTYLARTNIKIGDRLPSEAEMVKILGMSRNSIREAYARLSANGVLVRRHGVGTFLSKPQIINDFAKQRGFWDIIRGSGYTPSLKVLSYRECDSSDELFQHLSPPVEGNAVRMDWLFSADDVPVVYVQHVVSPVISLHGIVWSDAHNLMTALQDRFNPNGAELEVVNTAVNAPREIGKTLDMQPDAALLYGTAKVYLADGTVPIVSRNWSNPRYTAVTQREPLYGVD